MKGIIILQLFLLCLVTTIIVVCNRTHKRTLKREERRRKVKRNILEIMQYFWSLNVRALASDFLKIFHFTILKATLSMRSWLIVISKVSHKKPIGLPSHTTPPTTKMRKKKLQLGTGSKGLYIYIYIYSYIFLCLI